MLKPYIVGKWDGHSFWLQWNPVEGAKYDVEFRKCPPAGEWTDWQRVVPVQGKASAWGVVPIWTPNARVSARVRVEGGEWETACAAEFGTPQAEFEISSTRTDFHVVEDTIFSATVDGAPCSYRLLEEILVKAGEELRVTMKAVGTGGYFQLDRENHFDIRPLFGVRVRNITESWSDLVKLEGEEVVIEPGPQHVFTMSARRPPQY